MFAILSSAFNAALGWVFRAVLIKFLVAFSVFYLVRLVAEVAVSFVPSAAALQSAFSAIPAGVWFFLDAFQIGFGLNVCFSAYVSSFIIRRMS